jgi:hypothetical protein
MKKEWIKKVNNKLNGKDQFVENFAKPCFVEMCCLKVRIIKSCQNLKSVRNVKIFLTLLTFLCFLIFFGKLHIQERDISCRAMFNNGTSQGGTLDSWHTSGCNIHYYNLT